MENPNPNPLFHKPPGIIAAKNILYTVMFLVVAIWTIDRLNYGIATAQSIITVLIVLALLFVLTKCSTLGLKWARSILLLVFLVWVILYILGCREMWNTRIVVAVLTLLELILEALAIGFLFNQESTIWFNRVKGKTME